MKNPDFRYKPDLDNYGVLAWTGAKTIRRYREIREEMSRYNNGIFYAFSNKQFEEGVAGLKGKGLWREGEKLVRDRMGGYGYQSMFDERDKAIDAMWNKIAEECDPCEIYAVEYNNYECCIAWEGDEQAWRLVCEIFGTERCENEIKRYHGF